MINKDFWNDVVVNWSEKKNDDDLGIDTDFVVRKYDDGVKDEDVASATDDLDDLFD